MMIRRTRSRFESGRVGLGALAAVVAVAMILALSLWPETSAEHAPDSGSSPQAQASEVESLWTCSMHPEVLAEEPGRCPQCGMDLTPVEVAAATPVANEIVVSPLVVQNMGVRTALVERAPWVRELRTVGTIDYDERLVRDVTTRFDGWVEELYADYTGQFVREGMPLFRVYSRELYSTQEEYLLATNNLGRIDAEVSAEAAADMRELVAATRQRLRLFGVDSSEIDALEHRNAPATSVTIHSPHSGLIIEKNIREGMRTAPGIRLYSIADLSRVWVNVDIFEGEVPFVRIGQRAAMTLSYLPGQTFEGQVIYVYPMVDEKSRTVRVRLEFDNAHHVLKPGMFANIEISARLEGEGLVIPRAAMIDTGARQVVFVDRGEGRFESRDVRAGVELDGGRIAMLEGLSEGEKVVVSGQFLLDSESKLREAIAKMMEERRSGTKPGVAETAQAGTEPELAEPAEHCHGGEHPPAAEARAGAPDGQAALGFEPVMRAYLDLQETLAADRYAEVGASVAALRAALQSRLGATLRTGDDSPRSAALDSATRRAQLAAQRMADRKIDSVRAQFTDLSAALIDWMLLVHPSGLNPEGAEPWHTFHCPMAGADWVQRGATPRNPYYGFSMHRCGDAVDPVGRAR